MKTTTDHSLLSSYKRSEIIDFDMLICIGEMFELITLCSDTTQINGSFTSWTEWTGQACDEGCGQSYTRSVFRSRTCSNPAPANGGSDCVGERFETKVDMCILVGCESKSFFFRMSISGDME